METWRARFNRKRSHCCRISLTKFYPPAPTHPKKKRRKKELRMLHMGRSIRLWAYHFERVNNHWPIIFLFKQSYTQISSHSDSVPLKFSGLEQHSQNGDVKCHVPSESHLCLFQRYCASAEQRPLAALISDRFCWAPEWLPTLTPRQDWSWPLSVPALPGNKSHSSIRAEDAMQMQAWEKWYLSWRLNAVAWNRHCDQSWLKGTADFGKVPCLCSLTLKMTQ